MRTNRGRFRAPAAAALAALSIVGLAGCAEKENLATGGGTTTLDFPESTAPNALERAEGIDRAKEEADVAEESARCIGVPGPIAAAIREGLVSGVRLTDLRAVRSDDYERIWMVSGRLEGEGLDGSDAATWATNKFRDAAHTGLIFAAEFLAEEFSDWGNLDGQFSDSDDGVAESQLCALGLR